MAASARAATPASDSSTIRQAPVADATTGRRGSGRFEEISWNAALGEVAERLSRIAGEHGPEAAALFYHGSGGKYFSTLFKAFGSPNFAQPPTRSAAGRAMKGIG